MSVGGVLIAGVVKERTVAGSRVAACDSILSERIITDGRVLSAGGVGAQCLMADGRVRVPGRVRIESFEPNCDIADGGVHLERATAYRCVFRCSRVEIGRASC